MIRFSAEVQEVTESGVALLLENRQTIHIAPERFMPLPNRGDSFVIQVLGSEESLQQQEEVSRSLLNQLLDRVDK